MIIVRELTGGLYYGTPRGISGEGAEERGTNTMTYTRAEIDRVSRMAFELARKRRKKLTSVDKSNVLETSQLWRKVVIEVSKDYPDVALDHILVDNCAMKLVLNPKHFDVVLVRTCSATSSATKARCWPVPSVCCPRHPSARRKPRAHGLDCTNPFMVPRPISRAKTKPTHSEPSDRWRPCWNTVSV